MLTRRAKFVLPSFEKVSLQINFSVEDVIHGIECNFLPQDQEE